MQKEAKDIAASIAWRTSGDKRIGEMGGEG